MFVVHAGADHTREGYRRKLFRDIKLLHLDRRELVPGYREGWSWLVDNLLAQGKLGEAQQVPVRLLNEQPALAAKPRVS